MWLIVEAYDRYKKYRDESLDLVILLIRNGTIKCGKHANLVKIDKHAKIKGKEFFNDERDGDK